MADRGNLQKGASGAGGFDLGVWQGDGLIDNLAKNGNITYLGFTLGVNTGAGSRLAFTGAGTENLSFCVYSSAGDLVGFSMNARTGISLANLQSGDYTIKVSGSDTADFSVFHTLTAAPAVSVDTADDFVVLFSGGYSASANRTYYYHDIKKMYEVLVDVYGIDASKIYVLYADGTDSGIDNAAGENSDMSFAANATVLAATESNLREVFGEISAAADNNDHFLFYSFDHGAESIDGSDYICGWNEMISDSDFTRYAATITAGYQTWIMSQCYSWGMLEDITVSDTVFCAASSASDKASHTAVSNTTGEVTAGFSVSVATGLEYGFDTTQALFEYVLAENRYSELDGTTFDGGDFSIFGYGAAVSGDSEGTGNQEHPAVIAAKLQVLDAGSSKELSEAAVKSTVAVSAKALALEFGEDVEKVRFYLTGEDGVRRQLFVDGDGSDGWSFLWNIDAGLVMGDYTLSAVAEDSSGERSKAIEKNFTICEENFHPEILSIVFDHGAYCAGSFMTVTGTACDFDRNGIDSVRIYLDVDGDGVFPYPEEYLGLAAVGADGNWSYSFVLPETLEIGSYRIMAEAVDAFDMMVGSSRSLGFSVAERIVSGLIAGSGKVEWFDLAAGACTVEISRTGFDDFLVIETGSNGVDLFNMSTGYEVRAKYSNGIYNDPVTVNESVLLNEVFDPAEVFASESNGTMDLFFVTVAGLWGEGYAAKHVGFGGAWGGTGEEVDLAGKNRITDVFEGSSDANVLVMTDDANGDALFADDIYSDRPQGMAGARIDNIKEVRAGAGDDIIDMTSSRYVGTGGTMTIFGGSGDDVIWANNGSNMLFGDGGNDRIVGGGDDDVIAGGAGRDTLHGGGGDDIFTFGRNWGHDTVTQLAGGTVTLWFAAGDSSYWNAETLTYSSNGNTVKVEGISADKVSLKFGSDESALYTQLLSAGAFAQSATQKVYEPSETVYTNDNFRDTTIGEGDSYNLYYGEYASNVTIASGGMLNICQEAYAKDVILAGGGLSIGEGGSATGILGTPEGGYLHVSGTATNISGVYEIYVSGSSAVVSSVNMPGGWVTVAYGATAYDIVVSSGVYASSYEGGIFSGVTVESDGQVVISGGGSANNVTINGGGYVSVYDGELENAVFSGMGLIDVFSGGTVNKVTVESGGTVNVYYDGALHNAIVNWGNVTLYNSAAANGVTINEGGSVWVYSSASISGAILNVSGGLYLNSGAVAENTTVNESAHFIVGSGVYASNTLINTYGSATVSSGGTMDRVTITSESWLFVESGGTATYVNWTPCVGTLVIADGATVTYLLSLSGCYLGNYGQLEQHEKKIENTDVRGSLYVMSDGSANENNIWGEMFVSEGGHANSNTVGQSGTITVYNGGAATNTTVNSGAILLVQSGGTATEIVENGGYVDVAEGAEVTFAVNTLSNVLVAQNSMTVHSNTVVNGATLGSYWQSGWNSSTYYGDMAVYKGGIASDVKVDYGNLTVFDGGTATATTVNSRGSMYISSGGAATEIVENGGYVEVAEGAEVTFAANTMSDITVSNRRMTVHSNTVVNGATLDYYGSMNIYAGGIGNDVKVTGQRAQLTVFGGGTVTSTTVNSRAFVTVSSGGVATEIVENGGYVEVAEGAEVTFAPNTISGITIGQCSMTVHSNTIANDVVIGSVGYYNYAGQVSVYKGGVVNNVSVKLGGLSLNGGSATNVTVSSGASMIIVNDGVVTGGSVARGGLITVSSGGTATQIVENGGYVVVAEGAEVTFAEHTMSNIAVSYCSMTVHSNTVVNGATLGWNGIMNVYSGGVAIDIVLSDAYASLTLFSGGTATGVNVSSGGTLIVSNGGNVESAKVHYFGRVAVSGAITDVSVDSGGSMTIVSGGTATKIIENGGYVGVAEGAVAEFVSNTLNSITVSRRSMTVHSNTVVNSAVLNNYGGMFVYAGGVVNNVKIVGSSGWLSVFDSGSVANVSVTKNGSMTIASGGAATQIIEDGGFVEVAEGADVTFAEHTMSDITVSNRRMTVHSNTVVNGATLGSSGSMNVYSGGVANDITINYHYAHLTLFSGAEIDGVVISSGTMTISSGGAATSTTVSSGTMIISSGGAATSTTVSGGTMTISNGGAATSTTVSGGTMTISSGGTASAIVENGGYVEVAEGAEVTFAVNSMSDITVSYCSMTVHSNTVVNGATLDAYGSMNIYSGGVANDITVNYFTAHLTLFSGAEIDGVVIRDGLMTISSGGAATSTIVSGGTMTISSGGAATSTTVNGGSMTISSGGAAAEIVENGGYVEVGEGADVTFAVNSMSDITVANRRMTVHSNTVVNGATLFQNGSMNIYSGGVANGATLGYYGSMNVYSGGVANEITVSGYGAHLTLFSGAEIDGVVINYGTMTISSGGATTSTTVNGGTMTISSGGAATAIVENGGYVHIEDGATVEFEENVISGGILYNGNTTVHSKTTIKGTVISYGQVHVFDGGKVESLTLSSGGKLYVSGGSANNISCYFSGNAWTSSHGIAIVVSDTGVATDINMGMGDLTITDGGIVSNVVVSGSLFRNSYNYSSSILEACVWVSSGGTVDNVILQNYGSATISFGGIAKDVCLAGGHLTVFSGGTATIAYNPWEYDAIHSAAGAVVTYLERDANVYLGSGGRFVSKADVFTDTVVGPYFTALIYSNGVMNNAMLAGASSYSYTSAATIRIYSGGVANSTSINKYGTLYISEGGIASSTTIFSGALYISEGGIARSTTISGGTMHISGGVASSTTVTGGALYISEGGVASSTTMTGGTLHISEGGVASSTTMTGGTLHIAGGGIANSMTMKGGTLHISEGGVASSTTISGGTLHISEGGIARGLEFAAGLRRELGGGTVEGLAVNANTFLTTQDTDISDLEVRTLGAVYVSGGLIAGATVEDRGILQLCAGTAASDILVASGGHCYFGSDTQISGELTIAQGATVIAFTGAVFNFSVEGRSADSGALVTNLSVIEGSLAYTITVSTDQASGVYRLAENAGEFNYDLQLFCGDQTFDGFNVGETLYASGNTLELKLDEENNLLLEVTNSNVPLPDPEPDPEPEPEPVFSDASPLSGFDLYSTPPELSAAAADSGLFASDPALLNGTLA